MGILDNPQNEIITNKDGKEFNLFPENETTAESTSGEKVKEEPNVLASEKSKLAACFYVPDKGQLFTLDQDCLIRLWDLIDGNCLRSYPLEVIDAPDYSYTGTALYGVDFHNGVIKPTDRKVQFAKLEPYNKRLVYVALEGGYLQVNNVYSGAVVYNKSVQDNLYLEHEISDILFFKQGGKQCAGVACWEGYVSFIS